MDRTTRWETEAIRKRPMPSGRRKPGVGNHASRNWVTLREAEAETGIPVNTLRKWVRRADLPSYLEADGDLALRMVDLDAVLARANELGRATSPVPEPIVPQPDEMVEPETDLAGDLPPETMIVPVDAWNKMLNQLGNLHEAGQQLAEARERAAKAETESKFLRAQLADSRNVPTAGGSDEPSPPEPIVAPPEDAGETEPSQMGPQTGDTTTYWRYLTSGWRDRRRRRG